MRMQPVIRAARTWPVLGAVAPHDRHREQPVCFAAATEGGAGAGPLAGVLGPIQVVALDALAHDGSARH
jgi:hypothetical protein